MERHIAIQTLVRQEARARARQAREEVKRKQERDQHLRLAFLPVLNWFVEHGENEETRIMARLALEDWENPAKRLSWLQWGETSGYLRMLDRACMNLPLFKRLVRSAPATEIERRMNGWVLEAAAMISKRKGYSRHPKRSRRA